jgi:sugar lactone lactonase YvrE
MRVPRAMAVAAVAATVTAIPVAAQASGGGKPAYHPGKATRTYAIPGAAVFPEGVATVRGSTTFFVSSNGDGTVFRGSLDRPAAEAFLPAGQDGRTTATGLEVDPARGRLFTAGAATGLLFVNRLDDGGLVKRFETGTGGFLNDVAVTPQGDAYVTDSLRPVLWKVSPSDLGGPGGGSATLTPFLDLNGRIPYTSGFNLNGIVSARDGRYLLSVQSNSGKLWRIAPGTGEAREVDLGGATLVNGDGLEIRGRTLYVVRNQDGLVVRLHLSRDLLHARVTRTTTDPTFQFPTSAALLRGRLMVVNSQFDKRTAGQPPVLPFTVSAIRRP